MLEVFLDFALFFAAEAVGLVMLGGVETQTFVLFRDAHGDHLVCEPVEGHAHYESVSNDDQYADDGGEELDESVMSPRKKAGSGEYTSENGGDDAAHAMRREDIQCVIDARMGLPIDGDIADKGGEDGDREGLANRYDIGAWGDGDKADDCADGGAHAGRLATAQTVKEDPRHHSRCARCVCVQECLDCRAVCCERRTAVEAEPAEPKHGRAENDEGDVGRQVHVVLLKFATTEKERASKRSDA